jgi:hypothetical protein
MLLLERVGQIEAQAEVISDAGPCEKLISLLERLEAAAKGWLSGGGCKNRMAARSEAVIVVVMGGLRRVDEKTSHLFE